MVYNIIFFLSIVMAQQGFADLSDSFDLEAHPLVDDIEDPSDENSDEESDEKISEDETPIEEKEPSEDETPVE